MAANQNVAAPDFNQSTRQSMLQIDNFSYSVGAPQQVQLPQIGFLANLWLSVNATFTTAATGTYTIASTTPTPNPYGIINRFRLFTNEGNELMNLTGTGLYLLQRLQRSSYDPRNPLASVSSTNTALQVYQAGTMTTSTTYTVDFNFNIPVALAAQLQAGLVLLQNNYTRITAELTFNDVTVSGNMITMGGTTPSISSVSVSTSLLMEIFNLPVNPKSYPDLSYALIQREDITTVGNTGDYQYTPLIGNTYLDFVMQFENNSARMVPANFTLMRLTYSQTQTVYSMTPQQMLARNRMLLGNIDLPDGVFLWPLAWGNGFPEIPNTRDTINTGQLTDMRLISTINSTVTLTNAQLRVVSRQLARIV